MEDRPTPLQVNATRRAQPRYERAGPRREAVPIRAERGRVWLNGREVGGTAPRLAHLTRSYD